MKISIIEDFIKSDGGIIDKVFNYAIMAFVLSIPLSLRVAVYSSQIDLIGYFNPFTTAFFNITDLMAVIIMLLFGIRLYKGTEKILFRDGKAQRAIWLFSLLFTIITCVSAIFAKDLLLVFYIAIKAILYLFMLYLFCNRYFSLQGALKLFIFAMLFQAILSFAQHYLQSSLGLSFLGETSFDHSTLGIAKIDVNDFKYIRSYGTFLHPNVLGGALVFALSMTFYLYRSSKKKSWLYAMVILFIGLIFTFSRSAALALLIGTVIYLFMINPRIHNKLSKRKIVIALILFVIVVFNSQIGDQIKARFNFSINDKSISDRLDYLSISSRMIADNPLGVGAGHFTIRMQEYTSKKLLPWDHQPVHNVFMLIANELGIISALILIILIVWICYQLYRINTMFLSKYDKNLNNILLLNIVMFIVISQLDHYFLTNSSMIYMTILISGFYVKAIDIKPSNIKKINLVKRH